jgi:hypothetical protein
MFRSLFIRCIAWQRTSWIAVVIFSENNIREDAA